MEPNPIEEATDLVAAIAELLQRAAAVQHTSPRRGDLRYAEALARTLSDHLEAMKS
jgi:hypothetical protein